MAYWKSYSERPRHGRWFASWRDQNGKKKRRAFKRYGDAVKYEETQRAIRRLQCGSEQLLKATHPKRRDKAKALCSQIERDFVETYGSKFEPENE